MSPISGHYGSQHRNQNFKRNKDNGQQNHGGGEDSQDFFWNWHFLPGRRKGKEALVAAGALVVAERQSKRK